MQWHMHHNLAHRAALTAASPADPPCIHRPPGSFNYSMKVAYLATTLATIALMRCHPATAPTYDHESDTTSRGLLLVLCASLSLRFSVMFRLSEASCWGLSGVGWLGLCVGRSTTCLLPMQAALACGTGFRLLLHSGTFTTCSSRLCSCCGRCRSPWRQRLWYRSWYWCSAHSALKGSRLWQPTSLLSGEALLGALHCNASWRTSSGPPQAAANAPAAS